VSKRKEVREVEMRERKARDEAASPERLELREKALRERERARELYQRWEPVLLRTIRLSWDEE